MSTYIFFPTNQYAQSTKSEQEIRQLIVEDLGSPEKNMQHILAKGHPLQKPYAYKEFGTVWREVLSTVCQLLPSQTQENQCLAADTFIAIVEGTISLEEKQTIFQLAVKLLNLWNWTVSEKWVQVIDAIIKPDTARLADCTNSNNNNSKSKAKNSRGQFPLQEVQKIILELGKPTQPIVCKVTAGRLIAVLCQYQTKRIKGPMIDILKGILMHPESEARRIWLSEIFPVLSKHMDIKFIQLHLQQKLFETVYDKNDEIGQCALEAILKQCQRFSAEQKSSRVVKLFIDAIGSKNEKIVTMTSSLIGPVYQKLQEYILKNQGVCVEFWQRLIEMSQSKNPVILNNFVYNLPGILVLSKPRYNVNPISEIYVELFYDNLASKTQLSACFKQMVEVFPHKKQEFKQIIFNMFEEVLDDEDEDCEEGYKVIDIVLSQFDSLAKLFIETEEGKEVAISTIEEPIIRYLLNYCLKLEKRRNTTNLQGFHTAFPKYINYLSSQTLQNRFLPRFYASLRLNLPCRSHIIHNVLLILAKEYGNTPLLSSYMGKVTIQLSKSLKTYQRDIAVNFFIGTVQHFSAETLQEQKIFEKVSNLANSQKSFRIKYRFMSAAHRLVYALSKQDQKELKNILTKMAAADDQLAKVSKESLSYLQLCYACSIGDKIFNCSSRLSKAGSNTIFDQTRQERPRSPNRLCYSLEQYHHNMHSTRLFSTPTQRILTRKELFSIKDIKYYLGKEDPVINNSINTQSSTSNILGVSLGAPLKKHSTKNLTHADVLPRINHRGSVQKPSRSKLLNLAALKINNKRA